MSSSAPVPWTIQYNNVNYSDQWSTNLTVEVPSLFLFLLPKCGQMTVSRDTNKQHNITQSVGDMFCVMNSSALQPPVPIVDGLTSSFTPSPFHVLPWLLAAACSHNLVPNCTDMSPTWCNYLHISTIYHLPSPSHDNIPVGAKILVFYHRSKNI